MSVKAVIDLGTNTFHLLIAEISDGKIIRTLHRDKQYIRLAENGIQEIGAPAFERGLQAIRQFSETLKTYDYTDLKAFGTAALRTAKNAPEFIRKVKDETGIEITLIGGIEEASLIQIGVFHAIPLQTQPYLILDIGGGSTEFVIVKDNKIHWSQSYPIGVSVLHHAYHHSDPLSEFDLIKLEAHINETLAPLIKQLGKEPCEILVGSSGTFDTILELLHQQLEGEYAEIGLLDFYKIHDWILESTHEMRQAKPEIPEERIDYIVVAMVLIRQVLHLMHARKILISNYALKEGMLLM